MKRFLSRVRNGFSILLGLGALILFLGGGAEAMRAYIYKHLLEHSLPELGPGDPSIPVKGVAWNDMTLYWEARWADSNASVSVGDWHIVFTGASRVGYDPTCGSGCGRALAVSGVYCSDGSVMAGSSRSGPCTFHLWQRESGEAECFFGTDGELAPSRMLPDIPGVHPRASREKIHLDCPVALLWPYQGDRGI
jgi:hypothetical protein